MVVQTWWPPVGITVSCPPDRAVWLELSQAVLVNNCRVRLKVDVCGREFTPPDVCGREFRPPDRRLTNAKRRLHTGPSRQNIKALVPESLVS